MNRPSYGDRDPIAALATPLAESAIALIRTAGGSEKQMGQSAIKLMASVFSEPGKLLSAEGNSLIHGWIIDPSDGKKIDEVMVSIYRAPRSYTGEDAAEISCHGGIAVVKAIMTILKKAGFREALPGEFTFRAFMNGKLDLTRAESVMELVAAKTHRSREQALRRLSGSLEKEIIKIKTMLVEVLSAAEIYLDYSEDEFQDQEDDEAQGRLPGRHLAEQAARRLGVLAENWRRERIYVEGALAVLAGRPNAGKSSLFNYLLREDRSIVTDVPGTTRDWIEALVSVEDIPLRIADTAGLRDFNPEEPASKESSDAEQIGIKRTIELLDKADLVLYVIDGLKGMTREDIDFLSKRKKTRPEKPVLILWNKTDLVPLPPDKEEFTGKMLALSARTGEGITALTHSIAALLESSSASCPGSDTAGIHAMDQQEAPGTERQKELIEAAVTAINEALVLADRDEPLDIIAPLLRSAINALGEITGEVSVPDILDVMFSRFCVGK